MEIPENAHEYEGAYALVGGMVPSLVLEDGSAFYLVLQFPLTADCMPEEGTTIQVTAVPEEEHPDRLDVYRAEADGIPLMPEMRPPPEGGGPGGSGRG